MARLAVSMLREAANAKVMSKSFKALTSLKVFHKLSNQEPSISDFHGHFYGYANVNSTHRQST